jgi:hypothetical protein
MIECLEFDELVQPWQLNPFQPISWFEMLQFSARGFFWLSQYLESIKLDCLALAIPVDGDTPIFNFSILLDERATEKALEVLSHVETQARSIGLDITADTAIEVREKLSGDKVFKNCQWLSDQVVGLQKIVEKELKGKVFIYSPPERAKFFPTHGDPHPFGESVTTAFPSSIYDIQESAMCLALARSSASVFHLMRTLEIGLAALGNVFGVSLAHTNWEPAIREIERKIREMHNDPTWKAVPNCKGKQESYAQAASHFGILKDAWRNYTMHVRGKYTEEEAEQIFASVKGFMQKLVALGLKETP